MTLEEFRNKYSYSQSTQVMQQYLDIKFANIDCLILFRMGDFYELFFEDAIEVSRVLAIALTKRGKSGDVEIPMCGVPFHALDNYLDKLIENGYRVAICDQLETPEEARKRGGYKAVVNREVVRIITPGTVVEESLIIAKAPNYLISIAINKNRAAICYLDLSTSDISVIEVPESDIFNEIARICPKEVLVSEDFRGSELTNLISKSGFRISYQVNSFFALNKCIKVILDFYKIASVKAIGELTELQISCIGSVLQYITLTQKQNIPKLPFPAIINFNNHMSIDYATRRNLELTSNLSGSVKGSLYDVIDHTVTKSGSRLLYKFISSPLITVLDIEARLKLTEFFNNQLSLTENIRKLLYKTGDLSRCLTRISMNRSTPRDLLSVKYTLEIAQQIKNEFFSKIGINLPDNIEELISPLKGDDILHDLIEQSIREDAPNSLNDGGIIKHEYHPKVAELADLMNNGKNYIENLKRLYQKETGIDSLKISHNNVIGLFIDITPKQSTKITDNKFIHRQTTITSVRYSTLELQKLESEMVNARSLMISLENELYNNICHEIFKKSDFLSSLAETLSRLDVFCNFAYIAEENNYVKPELSNDLNFDVIGGRHAVVEKSLQINSKSFIENDCNLSKEDRIWLITGPNMAGKSTYLRQNAIIAILAQIGSFVPSKKAHIGVIDKIFSRIGSGDDLLKGQSTFMVEMLETSAILAQSSERSLIILDEVGRGTSTYDGVAIAWSVLEYIHDKIKCRCLFATHYHELTTMSNFLPALRNYTVAIEELKNTILFLHKIIPGTADKSYGIHVAYLAGLPKAVIEKANEVLLKFEKTSNLQKKNVLKGESNNLNLFDYKSDNLKSISSNALEEEVSKIEPDQLTPKQALETLYKLKNLISTNK